LNRSGGLERVTGALRYTADLRIANALHVKLAHLNCARARIIAIDKTESLRVEGVRSIFTTADLPQPMPRYGPTCPDRPLLAVDETRFFGEPVAAVCAETEDVAEAAATLIRTEYEELPAVLTVDAARTSPGNTFDEWHFGWGEVDHTQADCVIENTYTFPMLTHFAIEPHAVLAAADGSGMTIWSPTQHPYVLQRVVASALGLDFSAVRILAPDPGGSFGGKAWPKFEPLLAWLALRTGRPVRNVMTLEETVQQARRTSARVCIRSGFTAAGLIAFQDIEADFLIGAYADIAPRTIAKASYAACGPYRTANARIVARAPRSNTTPSTAFRGFGTPQASWATESQLNEAALRLGMDPVEIRRRNLPARGEAFIPGDTPADGDWAQALCRASSAIGWNQPLRQYRGRGISLGIKSSSTASVSNAIARLHGDGSASIFSATSDMGQGARTIFTQIAARELEIDPARISIVMGDTSVVPFDSSTSASRSTVFMGNAILKACRDIKARLQELAAEQFGVTKEEIAIEEGRIRTRGRDVAFADFLKLYYGGSCGDVIGLGSHRSAYLPDHPLGGGPAFWEVMCAAAEVEVDIETGMVRILRVALCSDVGKALNRLQVEAQDEGAAVMGLGHTLMEHLILDGHGRILNLGALDYRIPTIQDIPLELHSELIENEDGPGPYGSKGAGEGGVLAIAAAIGSAVNEAAGVTIRDLPLTPERIWRAIREKGLRRD
jgi:CO/xanthine dehydrogenase Mo-binding subunit